MLLGGTSLVTTLPAPTMAFSPMVMLERIVAPGADRCSLLDYRSLDLPVGFGLQLPVGGRGPRIAVVDEHHAVADEDVVLNRDAFADERMARDLAALADAGVLLDLDEGADLRFVADLATVQVDELARALRLAPALRPARCIGKGS